MGRVPVIGDREELTIRRQWEHEILPLVWGNRRAYNLVRSVFRCISEDRLDDVTVATAAGKKRDLDEEERKWWEGWYCGLGFANVAVPKPAASNRDFARWRKSQSGLIFVLSNFRAFYERFMTRVGQAHHWTVANRDREGIVWNAKPATGYWLKVEIAPDCPRLGTFWNMLQSQIRLLTLPEYAILWYATKARTGQMLDSRTRSWLATRYELSDGQIGALLTRECNGQVSVDRLRAECLGDSSDFLGGVRASEVVPNAA